MSTEENLWTKLGQPEGFSTVLREWCWKRGYSDTFGNTWVFDDDNDYKYQPWKSRWATFLRWWDWSKRFMNQVLCNHNSTWLYSGGGRMELSREEAMKWYSTIWVGTPRESYPMIRHNWHCAKCFKLDHRYSPDFDNWFKKEAETANEVTAAGTNQI